MMPQQHSKATQYISLDLQYEKNDIKPDFDCTFIYQWTLDLVLVI